MLIKYWDLCTYVNQNASKKNFDKRKWVKKCSCRLVWPLGTNILFTYGMDGAASPSSMRLRWSSSLIQWSKTKLHRKNQPSIKCIIDTREGVLGWSLIFNEIQSIRFFSFHPPKERKFNSTEIKYSVSRKRIRTKGFLNPKMHHTPQVTHFKLSNAILQLFNYVCTYVQHLHTWVKVLPRMLLVAQPYNLWI